MELVIYKEKPDPKRYDKQLLSDLYVTMKKQRIFDESVIRLISEGTVAGFYHAGSGQEAIPTGIIAQMNQEDYLFYAHRGCNEMIAKGVPLDKLYADFLGNVYGTNKGLGAGIIHGADPERGVMGQPGTIGSSMTLAVGLGMAINYKQNNRCVFCTFGDGTANRELLHGAFNYAGIWKLPVIFVCQNNEYALGSYYKTEHAISSGYIAERGLSYGIPSYVVDGNDILAVYEVGRMAVERAKKGEGATFIEAKTMRHYGHFVGDPCVYMDRERQRDFIENKDPIKTFKTALVDSGMFVAEEIDRLDQSLVDANEKCLEEALSHPLPTEDRLYAGLFSTSPSPNERR